MDKSRIGIIGFSAGANLVLTVQQLDSRPCKIKATVAFYPPVDFVLNKEEHAYIPAGTKLDDPKLSPQYAPRGSLSGWLFVVGCEKEMLCTEAGEMVANLSGQDWEGENGRDAMSGDEGKTRWLRVAGQKIAYTHDIAPITVNETDEGRKERKRMDEEVWEVVSEWLMNSPFKK